MKNLFIAAFALVAIAIAPKANAQNPMVGGAAMYPTKNIVENAVNSKDHTTLVAAVKAAGLVETLESAGPFTVFAPTNEAFDKLPAGTVDNLVKPENKATLTKILTYHVVAGRVSSADLVALIKKGNGKAELKTVQGGTLTAKLKVKSNPYRRKRRKSYSNYCRCFSKQWRYPRCRCGFNAQLIITFYTCDDGPVAKAPGFFVD